MIYPDISFIILTWNSSKYIEKCILSIRGALNGSSSSLSYEFFIIDNGSTDTTRQLLKKLKENFPGNMHLIFLNKNLGTTYSRNMGLKRARGRYICILDSDVEICAGVIEKLIYFLSTDNKIALIAPRIVYPNGALQKSTDQFPTIIRKIYRYFFLKQIESKEDSCFSYFSAHSVPFEIDYAISAFWLIPHHIINCVGFLDEKIFYSPEDVDYCMRIRKAGFHIYYDPSVQVVHYSQEISRGFKINSAFRSHVTGLVYYFMKHRYLFISPVVRNQAMTCQNGGSSYRKKVKNK